MDVLFLDANIFFSAVYSKVGGSNYLFQLANKGLFSIVTSEYALKEAKINIEKKLGKEKLPDFYKLVVILTEVDSKKTTSRQLANLHKAIAMKDVPILASAINLKVDFLITLDKKDFMGKKMEITDFPFEIVTPGTYLNTILDA
ncbi:MAG: putative toxin-antitoxin system toxin component, PIN family [Candidatus Peregrinibacteria bacterium]|nr:putative toxin-antitoxin system toxin component, PIN family [Candidatus Peregrinibacteria bacterium]MDZ4244670.1 putative toxin-antitoxin system toxin component, PIN family [Candidatus Gracilibacteria bacterium]